MNLHMPQLRPLFRVLSLVSFGLVGAGLIVESLMKLNPCPLCIFQRVLYLVAGFLALIGFLAIKYRALGLGMAGLGLLTSIGGVVTASYQSYLQAYPTSFTTCGTGEMSLIEQLVDWLGTICPSLFMATGFCTTKEYILGLSLANWSVVLFSLLTFGFFKALRLRLNRAIPKK